MTANNNHIPECLTEFIRIDEDDTFKLPVRDETTQPICMLIIPEELYKPLKAFFPLALENAPENQFRKSRRVFFAIEDLPADVLTISNPEQSEVVAFFSGYSSGIPIGEWIGTPPAKLPVITYKEFAQLMGINTPLTLSPASTTQPTAAPEPESFDGAQIPQQLKNVSQWLCWKYEKRDGKQTKIPINPETYANTSAPDAAWSYEVSGMQCPRVWG